MARGRTRTSDDAREPLRRPGVAELPVIGGPDPIGPRQDARPGAERRRARSRWIAAGIVGAGLLGPALAILLAAPPAPRWSAPPQLRATPDPVPTAAAPPPPPPATRATPAPAGGAGTCTLDDLRLTNDGWDAAVGNTWTRVVATNSSGRRCSLSGYPEVRLEQGGPLALTVQRTDDPGRLEPSGAPETARPVGLDPGEGAAFTMWWRGYRTAADQQTPQRLVLRLTSSPATADVPLDRSPAPFDVVDGAIVEVGPWRARVG